MIVPMKKVSLVILEKERKSALRSLRKSGALHLEEKPGGTGEKIDGLLEIHGRVSSALSKLDSSVKPDDWNGPFDRSAANAVVDDILQIDSRIKELYASIGKITG